MTTREILQKTKAAWGCIRSAGAEEKNRLLLSTEEAISKIASDCGFRNISYFNRVFQERMHQTPGQFRSLSAENRTAI